MFRRSSAGDANGTTPMRLVFMAAPLSFERTGWTAAGFSARMGQVPILRRSSLFQRLVSQPRSSWCATHSRTGHSADDTARDGPTALSNLAGHIHPSLGSLEPPSFLFASSTTPCDLGTCPMDQMMREAPVRAVPRRSVERDRGDSNKVQHKANITKSYLQQKLIGNNL